VTTTAPTEPTTVEAVLAAVTQLGPAVAARAADVEASRRVPRDLLDDLVATGCFRTLLPRSHGGVGAELPAALRVVEALSHADASVGWTVMIGSATWTDLARLPRATFDSLYADGPDVMIAGAFSPSGVAVPVDGGYRVSGRWGFASGSPHADWIYGNCLEAKDGAPRLRIALFTLDEAEVEDTWHVMGLCGTGSHHFRVDNVVVPAERTCAILEDETTLDEPIVRIPPPSLFALHIAAMALGTARGALDDITGAAATKMPLLSPTALSTSPTFQRDLAASETQLRAARALLYESAEDAWATARAATPFSPERCAHLRSAAAHAVATAADVVTTAYRAGGGGSLYLENPLQRRLRDIHAVTQHFLVRPDTFTNAGAILAGQEIDIPIF